MKKNQKNEKERDIKSSSALFIGLIAFAFSVLAVILLVLNAPVIVSAVFGGAGILCGLASILFGKGGTLPAVIAIVAGLMCILAFAILSASKFSG